MGFELTLAVLEMEKTVCAVDRAASVTDKREITLKEIHALLSWDGVAILYTYEKEELLQWYNTLEEM